MKHRARISKAVNSFLLGVFAVPCDRDTHSRQTGLHLPRSTQRCWNAGMSIPVHRIIPGSPSMVSPIPKQRSAAQLSPGSGGRGRLRLVSKSPWQSPAAAGGSSRPDGDTHISKKWLNSSELVFPALLGTVASWRGDIHLSVGQGINALEEEVRPFLWI